MERGLGRGVSGRSGGQTGSVLQYRESGVEGRGCRVQGRGRGKLLGSRRELGGHGECRGQEVVEEEHGGCKGQEEVEEEESKVLEQESRGQGRARGSPRQ